MGKQKNRLTATKPQNHIAQSTYPVSPTLDPKDPYRLQRHCNLLDQSCLPCTYPTLTRTHSRLYRPAYPVPTLEPPGPSCPPCCRNQSCLPCTPTLQITQVRAAYPVAAKNGQPSAHLRSSLPYTRPAVQVGPEPATKSTKMNWPTLYRPHRRQRSVGRHLSRPSSTSLPCTPRGTQQHKTARDARTILTKSNLLTLHQPPGDDTSKAPNPKPLQLPELLREIIGEIEAKDGLPSADRNNKATLLLTGPFRTAKSSAKDLTPLVLKLQYAKYHDALRAPWKNRLLRR
jgi:hypothetical protein